MPSEIEPASFPPKPKEDIDWSSVNLSNPPTTNGHIEVHYSTSTKCWGQPKLVQDPYIRVHGLSTGLNYGQQCCEGMKAFRTAGKNAIHLFRPHVHAARMRHSARMVLLPEVPDDLFLECVRLAVYHNAEFVPPATVGSGFMYLRPVLFGAGPQLALQPPEDVIFAIYAAPVGAPIHGTTAVHALVVDEFDRAAPRGTGGGKIGGNYAPMWPYTLKAREEGYSVTLHLDSETRSLVEEFNTSAFIGLVDMNGRRELYQPDTENVVPSVTSESLVTIAKQEGYEIHREKIPFSGIGRFSQVFAVGTGVSAVPVRSVTRPSTGEKYEFSTEGPGLDLVSKLLATQLGTRSVDPTWCWEVTETPVYQHSN